MNTTRIWMFCIYTDVYLLHYSLIVGFAVVRVELVNKEKQNGRKENKAFMLVKWLYLSHP